MLIQGDKVLVAWDIMINETGWYRMKWLEEYKDDSALEVHDCMGDECSVFIASIGDTISLSTKYLHKIDAK